MKRRIKIPLTLELLVIAILTFFLVYSGMYFVLGVFNISTSEVNKFLCPNSFEDKYILESYKRHTKGFENFMFENKEKLKIKDSMNYELNKNFHYDFQGKTVVFLVNSDGEILNSNNNEKLLSIDKNSLKDSLQVKKYGDDIVGVQEVKKIDENLYMIVNYDMVILGGSIFIYIQLVLWPIVFAICAKGRLKYIVSINKGIKKLYDTGFNEKIPLKYNNELTELANTLNNMGNEIKENRENEKEFLLNISHDLRTPLTSILGFLDLIKQKKYDNEEEKERYFGVALEQCLYLKTLINEFFEFSKLKWKNTELNKYKIKLQELLGQVSEGFYPQLKEHDIELNLNFADKSLYREVDIDKFMRVLENILSNAVKYSKRNTVIDINLYEKDNKIFIEFWNTPEEEISVDDSKLIFKRFYKKDKSRNSKGAGLGLAISSEIVKLHGGEMKAIVKNERLGIVIVN
ncbi:Signal transduction histidine kinase [Clostridium cavendishii DSM 21758]|uniref:histidine kinase n=1 Tax=Clostridium cavendishii DSM 21758 TaxID=1121302 RepID=A0A1M6HZ63_9CLOT|nr:HAMP domain-containing sensor histidine kinase [Clostridium cavendishii]SHJ27384.1 Signal transduction histidine kinase [Clostridium cavendishii DSM 21758]